MIEEATIRGNAKRRKAEFLKNKQARARVAFERKKAQNLKTEGWLPL